MTKQEEENIHMEIAKALMNYPPEKMLHAMSQQNAVGKDVGGNIEGNTLEYKPLIREVKPNDLKFFDFRNPLFWVLIVQLLTLGSVWLTFIKVIDWLHAIATH